MLSRTYFELVGLLVGAACVCSARGSDGDSQPFIMANVQAKNVIKEFQHLANVAEEEIANFMLECSTLFDFTTLEDVDNWTEQSDTVRSVGMSKAVLVLQKTQVFQRGVFFTLLNPQPNGAAFAGVRTNTSLDLSSYSSINITSRAQGNNTGYKVVLRHNGLNDEPYPTYEQTFTAPISTTEFSSHILKLTDFQPYYRGQLVPDAIALNTSNITSFGLQVYGGVYSTSKQSGVSSLEITTITGVV